MSKVLERQTSGQRDDPGFTLIELLIVIVILGIIAAIVVAAVLNVAHVSAKAACQGNYKTVEGAAEAYKGQIGVYPSAFSDMTVQHIGLNGSMDGPWLKEAPNTYTPGAPPSITNNATYGLVIDSATDSIAVGTIKANGASKNSGSPLVDGNANCANA